MNDLSTMVRKEWRELFLRAGRPSWSLLGGLILVVLFGVAAPILEGILIPVDSRAALAPLYLDLALATSLISGVLAAAAVVVDSIAGERERHTIETLLATPLSDRTILLGKVLAVTLYGLGLVVLTLACVGLLMPLLYGVGRIDMPSPLFLVLFLLVSGLALLFIVGLGILISVYSASVRQGQQVMAVVASLFVIPLPVLVFLPSAGLFPGLKGLGDAIGEEGLVALLIPILLVVDVAFAFSSARLFRRPRLLRP